MPCRSMRLRRSGSRGTDRHRRHFESGGPSTSSNLKLPFNTMKSNYRISSKAIGRRPMSVLCSGTRTHSWSEYFLRKVCILGHHTELCSQSAGIDVQSELALKGSPHLRPSRPPMAAQASPMQKAMLNRQQGRQRPILAPPLQNVNQSSLTGGQRSFGSSPNIQPTPPSQHSSPATAKSPAFAMQGGMASPNSDFQGQISGQAQQRHMAGSRHQHQFAQQQQRHMRNMSGPTSAQAPTRSLSQTSGSGAYYQPQFQKHYDQLGKYTLSTPLRPYSGALFVLCLFREYRTGIRCTRRYVRRSRRRRHGSRQLHTEFQTTHDYCGPQRNASISSDDNSIRKRTHRAIWRYSRHRSI